MREEEEEASGRAGRGRGSGGKTFLFAARALHEAVHPIASVLQMLHVHSKVLWRGNGFQCRDQTRYHLYVLRDQQR